MAPSPPHRSAGPWEVPTQTQRQQASPPVQEAGDQGLQGPWRASAEATSRKENGARGPVPGHLPVDPGPTLATQFWATWVSL